jgi:hypothetical protein
MAQGLFIVGFTVGEVVLIQQPITCPRGPPICVPEGVSDGFRIIRFFLGPPSGVGKTETAQAFSRYLFEDGMLLRFDMSEYQTPESLSSLGGREPGGLGSITGWCSSKCAGTLLFDEIKKAHPRILDVFLQVLDAAWLSLASGTTVDLSGFYVVFTSNLGSREAMELEHSSFATMERHVLARAQRTCARSCTRGSRKSLCSTGSAMGCSLKSRRICCGVKLSLWRKGECIFLVDAGVLPFVVRQGYNSKLGARPMRDAVKRLVGDAVADWLLDIGPGGGANTLKVAPALWAALYCACLKFLAGTEGAHALRWDAPFTRSKTCFGQGIGLESSHPEKS